MEASCVLYPEISCHEVDIDGNKYPLTRFHINDNDGVGGGGGDRSSDPTPDIQLVKDVTDALRNKVRIFCQHYV